MKLFTEQQRTQLLSNGHEDNRDRDHAPEVKLTLPGTGCVWLLSEIDPDNPDIAFGLCDLGIGFPELGHVSVSELQSLLMWEDMPLQADRHFFAEFPMSVFVEAARNEEGITDDPFALRHAAANLRRHHRHPQPKPN